jgi:hypothetical protein
MTEEFKANPEFKDWYFKNYIALEKWRSIWKWISIFLKKQEF